MERAAERRSEEHTSELQSRPHLVCRLLLEKQTNCEGRPRPTRQSQECRGHKSETASSPSRTARLRIRTAWRPGSPCFFFNDTATTEIYTLSLHDALPI